MNFTNFVRAKKRIMTTAMGTLIAGLVSSYHYWYGATAYDTPWYAGVSYWIAGFMLIIYSLLSKQGVQCSRQGTILCM